MIADQKESGREYTRINAKETKGKDDSRKLAFIRG
jgi:hypothetical protein